MFVIPLILAGLHKIEDHFHGNITYSKINIFFVKCHDICSCIDLSRGNPYREVMDMNSQGSVPRIQELVLQACIFLILLL